MAPLIADAIATPADRLAALARIKGDWYDTGIVPPLKLLRRNFDGRTFMAGMPYDAPSTFSWLTPSAFVGFYGEFGYSVWQAVNGSKGVTLATMPAITAGIHTAFNTANPGRDRPQHRELRADLSA